MTANPVIVETQMLIRKPVAEVFQALIDPGITTKFWFTKSSGKLEEGKTITWEWEMYGASGTVYVKQIVPDSLIITQLNGSETHVDYSFTILADDRTLVQIKVYGFNQTGDDLIKTVIDNSCGFTSMLAGMKAYLEHGIQLNLVADTYPERLIK
jgi:uncharacterized protein YndB with AHSA1/START domain